MEGNTLVDEEPKIEEEVIPTKKGIL